jgi:hypothetical protein
VGKTEVQEVHGILEVFEGRVRATMSGVSLYSEWVSAAKDGKKVLSVSWAVIPPVGVLRMDTVVIPALIEPLGSQGPAGMLLLTKVG